MDEWLMKILVFITALQFINTTVNVVHKVQLIEGPPAHVAMALLSMIILFGYSGILNTLFLRRNFSVGRIVYLTIAVLSQCSILTLSIMAWTNVITYFVSIAIIHAIMGFIVAINFVCAVYVVHEQQMQIVEAKNQKKRQKYQNALKLLTRWHDRNVSKVKPKSQPFMQTTGSQSSSEKVQIDLKEYNELKRLRQSLLSEE